MLSQLPKGGREQLGPTPSPEHVRFRIIDDLLYSFGDPEKRCETLKASFVFKDVTYDMLKEPNFGAEIAGHFPDLLLMEEFKAAKERPISHPKPVMKTHRFHALKDGVPNINAALASNGLKLTESFLA